MVPWHLQPKYSTHQPHPQTPKQEQESRPRFGGEGEKAAGRPRVRKKQRPPRKKVAVEERLQGSGNEEDALSSTGLTSSRLGRGSRETPSSPSLTGGSYVVMETETELPCSNIHCSEATPTGHMTSKPASPDLAALGYQTFHRYYHVFCQGELVGLVNEVGGVKIVEEFYDHENWCVIGEKIMNT